jgi:hypothetical protein
MLARGRELLAALAEQSGVSGAGVHDLEEALFARYAFDCDPYFDAMEPSLSATGERVDAYRFSYAFPAFRRDRRSLGADVIRIAATCGEAAAAAARLVVRAAEQECVEQPLVGYSDDGAGARRFKLYLMFRSSHDVAARALAREVVGAPHDLRQDGSLHMLGLDVGGRGVSGAKLYFEHESLALTADYGFRPMALGRALAIHALRAPDDAAMAPVALDFSLREPGLTWATLQPEVASRQPALARLFKELDARFHLEVRRLSLFRGEPGKVNLYYVLDPRYGEAELATVRARGAS